MSYENGLIGVRVEYDTDDNFSKEGIVVERIIASRNDGNGGTRFLVINDTGEIDIVDYCYLKKIIPSTEFEKVSD